MNPGLKDNYEVKKWLSGIKKSSAAVYLCALDVYAVFTGLNPTQLIDEIEEDRKKSRREMGKPEQRVNEFHRYLLSDYERSPRGVRRDVTKGISTNMAATYVAAIRSFYKANGFPLIMRSPKASPKKENVKLSLAPRDVKLLVDHASTLRNRAIIFNIFQGGFGGAEICSLDYGDVARELEANKCPMLIHVVREKEQVDYYTCIGEDAITSLRAYLNERRRVQKWELKMNEPLFVKEGSKKLSFERITPNLISTMLKNVAVKSGLVSQEEMNNADMNPARPHALRSAFSTILRLNGFNDTIVDFMMGHKIAYNGAYFIPPEEKLREMYKGVEHCFSTSGMPELMNEKLESQNRILGEQRIEIENLKKSLSELEGTGDKIVELFKDEEVQVLMAKKMAELGLVST